MFELVLLFTAMVLLLIHEITPEEIKENCISHTWSMDFNTEELICLQCNFKVR